MSDNIKELARQLRLAREPIRHTAALALETLAGEVERLTSDVDALGENLEKVVAERDRLKETLLDIKHFGAGFAQDRARKALGDAA